jgi:hypothetical protein
MEPWSCSHFECNGDFSTATGVLTSVRRLFAQTGVNWCNGDFSLVVHAPNALMLGSFQGIIALWKFLFHPVPRADSLLNNDDQPRLRLRVNNRWSLAIFFGQERTGLHSAVSVLINPASFGRRLARIHNDTGFQYFIHFKQGRVVPKVGVHRDEGGSWIVDLHLDFSIAVCFQTCERYAVFRRDGAGWWLVFKLTNGDPHLPKRFAGERIKKADFDRSCRCGTQGQTQGRENQHTRDALPSKQAFHRQHFKPTSTTIDENRRLHSSRITRLRGQR